MNKADRSKRRWCSARPVATVLVVIAILIAACIGVILRQPLYKAVFAWEGARLSKKPAIRPRPAWLDLPEVDRLYKIGFVMGGDEGGPSEATTMPGTSISDADLACLGKFQSLEYICLINSGLTGAVLEYLRPCPNIRALELNIQRLDDKSLDNLEAWPKLESLKIRGGCFSEKGAECIGRAKALRLLYLINTPLTNGGLKSIGNLTNLESLILNESRITDAGINYLLPLKYLTCLSISGCAITDKAFETLAEMHSVRDLGLAGTNVSIGCLQFLAKMKSLKRVTLQNTTIRKADVTELRHIRPDLEISVEDMVYLGQFEGDEAARRANENRGH
jgi:hypothetical protein